MQTDRWVDFSDAVEFCTNAKDQRRSEATFHLRDKVYDKRGLIWCGCVLFTTEQTTEYFVMLGS